MTDLSRHSGFGEQEDHGGNTQANNRRTNSAGNQQTTETGTRSTLVGATSSSQLRESRHHLPIDETTHRHSRRAEPVSGPQHGKDSRSPHLGEDVGPVQLNHINHRHPESFAELDRFPTSPRHNSPNHRRSLCTEKTDHQTSQPTKITIETSQKQFCTSLFLRDEETFCSWGRCRRSKSISQLERQPAQSISRLSWSAD